MTDTYRAGGPHSFFLDHLDVAMNLPGAVEARARLAQHAQEVGRGSGTVTRAMSTTANAGGQFVTPEYLSAEYAVWLNYPPTFAKAAIQVPDPGYGMQMNLPALGSASTVTQPSENSAVGTASPSSSYIQGTLVVQAGEVDVSQQLQDRAGPESFDLVVGKQLDQDLWAKVDTFCMTQALSGVTPVAGAATFTAAKLWADLGDATSLVESTAGSVLPATHIFLTPALYRYLLAQPDPQGRPLLLPNPIPPADTNDPSLVGLGYTGERILDVPTYRDGNIPTVSAGVGTQLIVANMQNVYVQTTEPAVRVVWQTKANSLTVIIQKYCYVGIILRHAGAVQSITGAAYPAAPTFTL